ncbi:MAG: 4Fe-4S dicluster domain-containing protein [Chloroflexi bacterium]|nr:4Fe-4S dicluster domain-containing protein [Chloroflexota bacterium]
MAVTETRTVNSLDEEVREPRARGRRRGHVQVFAKWCKGCGLCIAFCPKQVFDEGDDNRPIVARPENCIGCEWCEIHCPDFAISVSPYLEVAVEGVAK